MFERVKRQASSLPTTFFRKIKSSHRAAEQGNKINAAAEAFDSYISLSCDKETLDVLQLLAIKRVPLPKLSMPSGFLENLPKDNLRNHVLLAAECPEAKGTKSVAKHVSDVITDLCATNMSGQDASSLSDLSSVVNIHTPELEQLASLLSDLSDKRKLLTTIRFLATYESTPNISVPKAQQAVERMAIDAYGELTSKGFTILPVDYHGASKLTKRDHNGHATIMLITMSRLAPVEIRWFEPNGTLNETVLTADAVNAWRDESGDRKLDKKAIINRDIKIIRGYEKSQSESKRMNISTLSSRKEVLPESFISLKGLKAKEIIELFNFLLWPGKHYNNNTFEQIHDIICSTVKTYSSDLNALIPDQIPQLQQVENNCELQSIMNLVKGVQTDEIVYQLIKKAIAEDAIGNLKRVKIRSSSLHRRALYNLEKSRRDASAFLQKEVKNSLSLPSASQTRAGPQVSRSTSYKQ